MDEKTGRAAAQGALGLDGAPDTHATAPHGSSPASVPSGRVAPAPKPRPASPFIRCENEDDDGYDPYSDRPARKEPLFERDPWS